MSANDQILIKKHKGKWYVFNVMAESWSEDNELSIEDAKYICRTISGAYRKANKLHSNAGMFGICTEYGIGTYLLKDGANVKIIWKKKELRELEEIVTVNAKYFTLKEDRKVRLLANLKLWVDNEISKLMDDTMKMA